MIKEFSDQVYDKVHTLDAQTYKHCNRVSRLCEIVENEYNLDNTLSMAAKVHDIGKIYFSESINNKIGVFNSVERSLMSLHPFLGFSVLNELNVPPEICSIVLLHHGNNPTTIGKPDYLLNDKIKFLANILNTIDSFEALTSKRTYRQQFSLDETVEILKKEPYASKEIIEMASKGILTLT